MDHQPGQTAAGRAPRQLLAGDPLLPHRRARRPTRLSGQLSRSLPVDTGAVGVLANGGRSLFVKYFKIFSVQCHMKRT